MVRYRKYDFICALGYACGCAQYMKRAGLRSCAGPFDWIGLIDMDARVRIIESDFADFMHIEDFVAMSKSERDFNDKACDAYMNRRTKLWFVHDFPTGVPFADAFPRIAAKYERRIERFRENMRGRRRILMPWFSLETETPDDVIVDCCDRLCRHFGKTIDFLVIEHRDNVGDAPVWAELAPNITRVYVDAKTPDVPGLAYMGTSARVMPIFARFGCRGAFRRRVVKHLVSTIPFRAYRHRLRSRLKERGISA